MSIFIYILFFFVFVFVSSFINLIERAILFFLQFRFVRIHSSVSTCFHLNYSSFPARYINLISCVHFAWKSLLKLKCFKHSFDWGCCLWHRNQWISEINSYHLLVKLYEISVCSDWRGLNLEAENSNVSIYQYFMKRFHFCVLLFALTAI